MQPSRSVGGTLYRNQSIGDLPVAMGIITSVTIPGEQFVLGRPLRDMADASVVFEQLVPTTGQLLPYLWLYGDVDDGFEESWRTDPAIDHVETVYRSDSRRLLNVEWSAETDGFVDCLREEETTVLQASGTGVVWTFELRFGEHDALKAFQQMCHQRGISLTVDRLVTNGATDAPGQRLTNLQRETIELALERGYFDVPRNCTMVDLAEELGISDQAVSARIRRGMKQLSEQLLHGEVLDNADVPDRPQ